MVHHLDRPDGLSDSLGLGPEEFRRSCHLLSDSMMAVGGSAAAKHHFERSLRFKGAQWLTRTNIPGSGGHIATYSAWVKLGAQTPVNTGHLIYGYSSGIAPSDGLHFNTDGTIRFYGQGEYDGNMISTAMFRDYSAWYHIVCAVDTTQATDSERLKIYVNGNRQTLAAGTRSTYPSLNHVLAWTTPNCLVALGRENNSLIDYFDGYMADVHLIDGQALLPSSFGKFDDNGVWVAIRYAGLYGTNGCRLEFKDAANLGYDSSGRGNHWTVNGLTAADQMKDTPSNNYCTLNPLSSGGNALSNGNLRATISTASATGTSGVRGTFGVSTGKWYWEITCVSTTSTSTGIGVVDAAAKFSDIGYTPGNSCVLYMSNSQKYVGGTGINSPYASTYVTGDVISVLLNCDGRTINFWKNGAPQGDIPLPAAGIVYTPCVNSEYPYSETLDANFGQSPFAYTPPADFKALCTANLPAVSIKKPKNHFNTVLYTGNGGTQEITGMGFSPGLLALKNRSFGWSWTWLDEVRGVSKALASDNTNAEYAQNPSDNIAYGSVSSLDSDGFSVVCGTQAHSYANYNGEAYVGFAWKGAGAATLNNDGTIPSQVSANPAAGFSIATYTGTGGAGTVGHGLGKAPKMVIVKKRTTITGAAARSWYVYHTALGASAYALLDLEDSAYTGDSAVWNSNSPTENVFSLGTFDGTNGTSNPYVAYCFAEIPGYSKFGSYVGNGSDNGPFVHCGFRPRWIMVKRYDSSWHWTIVDTERNSGNPLSKHVDPDSPEAENFDGAGINMIDAVASGFKVRDSGNNVNGPNSSSQFIYAAFAEHPFGGSNVAPSPAR